VARRWSHRGAIPTGVLSVITVVFWAVWVYLVMPLLTGVAWYFGVRLFTEQMSSDGYDGLRQSLLAYSTVLLGLVGLLMAWIAWNVLRYGGNNDRRTVKRPEVTDPEIWEAFRLDATLLETLREARMLRLDLDPDGCVVLHAAIEPRLETPPHEERVGAGELVGAGAR
jgi:poly-beta-1,6-N-acetyl-D-glucosamine biosynthesis protein PgaD